MKNATESAKKLKSLLAGIKPEPTGETAPREPLEQLVYAFLLYDTTRRQADQAYPRLMKAVVDINDLRVSDPADIVLAIGERYSRAVERATAIKYALHSIYLKEHDCTLEHLKEQSKRDARQYLEQLDAISPFVVASVMLFGLGGHAVAVDEQLARYLKRDEIVDEQATLPEVQSFLEHHIKAAEGFKAHDKLRTYAEATGGAGESKKKTTSRTKKTTGDSRRTTKTTAGKKTTKKKTATKAATKKSSTKKSTTRSRS